MSSDGRENVQDRRQEKAAALAGEILKLAQNTLMIKLRFFDMALSRFTLHSREGVTGTDGTTFWYDPWQILDRYRADRADVNRLTLHALVHCIAGHLYPEPSVDRRLWGLCCDMAAESVVLEMDVSAEEAADSSQKRQELRRFAGKNGLLTAGRLYARLQESPLSESRFRELEELFHRDDHALWHYRTEEAGPGEDEECRRFWKYVAERIQTDLETASAKYGAIAGALLQNLRDVNRERRDYADFLRAFATSGERMRLDDDEFDIITYTYGMRLLGNMPLIEPLEYKDVKNVKDFLVVLDPTREVDPALVERFAEKTFTVLKQQETFFTRIRLFFLCRNGDALTLTEVTDQKGFDAFRATLTRQSTVETDYRPVFQYVEQRIREKTFANLKGLLYFTDSFGPYPTRQPDFPTAFVFLNDDLAEPRVPVWAIRLMLQSDEI